MNMALQRHVVVLLLLSCLFTSSYSYQFTVGGKDGWVPNPSVSYNTWSQHMRFQVNDSVLFKYKQGADSVLEVSKDDYDKCNTGNPIKKLEDGNSIFTLDRSGPFYFISGNKDNCDKGQKVQIVVISVRNQGSSPAASPPKGSSTPGTPSAPSANSPAAVPPTGSSSPGASSPNGAPISTPAGNTPTASPPTPATGGSMAPAMSPVANGPSTNTPGSSSPAAGGPSGSMSPAGGPSAGSLAPAAGGPSAGSLAPAAGGPSAGSLAPAGGPSAGSLAPAGGPSAGSLAPAGVPSAGSLAPAGGPSAGSLAPAAGGPASGGVAAGPGGNTPADINSPAGSPENPNSFAVKAFTPSIVLVSAVSLVLTVALGEFIILP